MRTLKQKLYINETGRNPRKPAIIEGRRTMDEITDIFIDVNPIYKYGRLAHFTPIFHSS